MVNIYIEIITNLINMIQFLISVVIVKKFSYKYDQPVRKEYRKLKVDSLPIIEKFQPLDCNKLLNDYFVTHGKHLKPVKHRSITIPNSVCCPRCNAPHTYIYDNNGGKGQFLCKVCKTTFYPDKKFKSVVFKCPHCGKTLEKVKERKDFDVYKCKNDSCSFYLNNYNSLSDSERQDFEANRHKYKLRYIYRAFNIDFLPLKKEQDINTPVDISKIHAKGHLLGLVLTYYVNYGLSTRKTAALLKDVHGVNISHQTVLNYANSVSLLVKPFVDNYNYQLSDSFCGDETYIKVNGKWNYIFFMFDAVKKIILSYRVSPNRDTFSAIKAINDVLVKIKSIPENLKIITDGNPIYLLAQHFFAGHNINFDITQVIGLSNNDPVSKEYRPLKQIIERLNRTFKGNYKPTTGFSSDAGSVAFVTLFVAYFNFLRPHSALEKRVPVVIPELEKYPNMPAKWLKLIELSQNYILSQAS